jgi:hypothetical protein
MYQAQRSGRMNLLLSSNPPERKSFGFILNLIKNPASAMKPGFLSCQFNKASK